MFAKSLFDVVLYADSTTDSSFIEFVKNSLQPMYKDFKVLQYNDLSQIPIVEKNLSSWFKSMEKKEFTWPFIVYKIKNDNLDIVSYIEEGETKIKGFINSVIKFA